MSDRVTLLDGKRRTLDIRFQVRGDDRSGMANVRMRVTLDMPRFDLHVGGKELAQRIAKRAQVNISQKLIRGQDAQGRPLQAIKPQTQERRERRARQREDGRSRGGHAERRRAEMTGDVTPRALDRILSGESMGAKRERFILRGRGSSKLYDTVDMTTPFHESGLAAENVFVAFKATQTGDPEFLLGFPTGGSVRGMDIDDGRGARLFAAEHYGFLDPSRDAFSIPDDMDAEIEQAMDQHLDSMIAGIGAVEELVESVGELGAELGRALAGDVGDE